MNPELETAIRERIDLGHSQEQIAAELRTAGYDEETITAVYEAVASGNPAPIPPAATALPSATSLFSGGWQFMTTRLDLVAALALPGMVFAWLEYSEGMWPELNLAYGIVAVAVVLVSIAAAILLQVAAAYSAMQQITAGTNTSLRDGLSWAQSHVWAWLWVVILSSLVIFGGFALLIVPGIIAAIYISLAQYIYIAEGTKGMAALQRSRALLTGRFWPVLGRYLLLGVFVMLLYIPVIILVGVVASTAGESVMPWVAAVVEGIVGGVVSVISVYVVASLYAAIAGTATTVAPTGWYRFYAWVGVVSILLYALLIGAMIALFSTADGLESLPDGFDFDQVDNLPLTPEEQAEFDAFLEQFGDELRS